MNIPENKNESYLSLFSLIEKVDKE